MAFTPTPTTKDVLMWMLSTKMMPAVGVLVPMYLIFRDTGLLDTRVGADHGAHPDQPADRHLDALHLLQGDPGRHPRSGAHGRRHPLEGAGLRAGADGGAGHRLDAAAQRHPRLERGVLDHQPDRLQGGAADRLHLVASQSRRACSGPSCPPPRRSPSRRSWCWAGSARSSWCAA